MTKYSSIMEYWYKPYKHSALDAAVHYGPDQSRRQWKLLCLSDGLALSLSLFSLLLILSTYGARGFLITSIEIKGHAGSQFLPGI